MPEKSMVGKQGSADMAAPMSDNVKRSVPPMVKGASNRKEGDGPHGTGGKSSRYAGLTEKLKQDCSYSGN